MEYYFFDAGTAFGADVNVEVAILKLKKSGIKHIVLWYKSEPLRSDSSSLIKKLEDRGIEVVTVLMEDERVWLQYFHRPEIKFNFGDPYLRFVKPLIEAKQAAAEPDYEKMLIYSQLHLIHFLMTSNQLSPNDTATTISGKLVAINMFLKNYVTQYFLSDDESYRTFFSLIDFSSLEVLNTALGKATIKDFYAAKREELKKLADHDLSATAVKTDNYWQNAGMFMSLKPKSLIDKEDTYAAYLAAQRQLFPGKSINSVYVGDGSAANEITLDTLIKNLDQKKFFIKWQRAITVSGILIAAAIFVGISVATAGVGSSLFIGLAIAATVVAAVTISTLALLWIFVKPMRFGLPPAVVKAHKDHAAAASAFGASDLAVLAAVKDLPQPHVAPAPLRTQVGPHPQVVPKKSWSRSRRHCEPA